MEEISSRVEEYLEAIHRLEEKKGVAKTSELAETLNVTFGTVTNTVENLEKQGLIVHVPYKGIKLTNKGRKIALSIIRKHRLSERLLTDILGMNWSKVHDAACRLEHSLTDDVLKHLERILGHPSTCPHGNPIPTKCGGIFEEKSEPLTNLVSGEKGIIVKVTEEKPEVLEYLEKLKLLPGTLIEVEEKAPFEGPITLKIAKTSVSIGYNIASIIYVKKFV